MTESSRFWNTNNIGDGPTAGFDRDAVAGWLRAIFARGGSGVLRGVLNELAATGTASPIAVDTGAAIVYGLYYWSTASVNLTVTTPSVGTTGGRVILRASWSAQTVRLVAVRNTDGVAAIPSLTQTPGTTYEISLATFTITTGGVISLTDDRGYATFADSPRMESLAKLAALSVIARASSTTGQSAALAPSTDGYVLRRSGTSLAFGQIANAGLADNAVTDAKIRQSAGLSVLGRHQTAAITTDIVAASDGGVMRRSGSAIAFGEIATAEIPDAEIGTNQIGSDAVDDVKAGNRVPQFYRRQGGDSNHWNTPGATTYTPTTLAMCSGCVEMSLTAGDKHGDQYIRFPLNFTYIPLIFLNVVDSSSTPTNQYTVMVNTSSGTPSETSFYIMLYRKNAPDADTVKVHWMAIGPY